MLWALADVLRGRGRLVDVIARLADVHKRYGETPALQGVSLEVPAGQLLALLGPNGAGKTTVLQLLCGLRRPDSGTVELAGGDPRNVDVRRQLGVTPQQSGFPEALKVREVVDLVRAHYPNPWPTQELLVRFSLADLGDRQTGGLSGGQQRRLAVALAFAGRPRLVLLDEPTTGLDTEARRSLWRVLREELAGGTTILLTTHYLEEAEELCEEIALIRGGRLLARDSAEGLRERYGAANLAGVYVKAMAEV